MKAFLGEIAEWCEDMGYPHINALVVSKESGKPGKGYSKAAGCNRRPWPREVAAVIAFDYPVIS